MWCPSGSTIHKLERFGLQRVDAKEEDNKCPQTNDKAEAEDGLKLDLDEQCSLNGLKKEFPKYFNTLKKQF